MTEEEYIAATDLTKLRLVADILPDTFFVMRMRPEARAAAMRFLFEEIERLEEAIRDFP